MMSRKMDTQLVCNIVARNDKDDEGNLGSVVVLTL